LLLNGRAKALRYRRFSSWAEAQPYQVQPSPTKIQQRYRN
jgi:hypothetical protein